jgi:putative flippase GtrA
VGTKLASDARWLLGIVSIRATLLQKLARFALVSGLGLVIDVGVFLLLLEFSLRTGYANLVSAATAVTFVYFVSTRHVFAYHGRFLMHLFAVYAVYQIAAVTAASWAVDFIARMGAVPIIAKALILPVTFSANYIFMDFLTKTKPGRHLGRADECPPNILDDQKTII